MKRSVYKKIAIIIVLLICIIRFAYVNVTADFPETIEYSLNETFRQGELDCKVTGYKWYSMEEFIEKYDMSELYDSYNVDGYKVVMICMTYTNNTDSEQMVRGLSGWQYHTDIDSNAICGEYAIKYLYSFNLEPSEEREIELAYIPTRFTINEKDYANIENAPLYISDIDSEAKTTVKIH